MMKVQELIDQYNQAVEAEERARAQKKAETIQAAKDKFLEFCRIWLGDFWDEFQPGEVSCREDNTWQQINLCLSLPVSFMDVPGALKAQYLFGAQNQSSWNQEKLDFGQLTMPDGTGPFVSINLSIGRDDNARPIDPRDLGALLSHVEKAAPIHAENERKHLERERADALVFHGNHIPWVKDQIELRIKKFPDLEKEIRESGRVVIEEVALQELERQQENARFVAMQEERKHLEELAARAWKTPFTVYEIKFGAFIGDGEGSTDFYAESIYTLEDGPMSDDYYRAFDRGVLSRRIRPEHILSTERITVTDCTSAPHELKRYVDIHSNKFPDVTAYVALPPEEFSTLDVETLLRASKTD